MDADQLPNESDRKAAKRAERRHLVSTYKERVTRGKEKLVLRDRDFPLPRDTERLSMELGNHKRRKHGKR